MILYLGEPLNKYCVRISLVNQAWQMFKNAETISPNKLVPWTYEPPITRDWIRTTHNRIKRHMQSLSLLPEGEG